MWFISSIKEVKKTHPNRCVLENCKRVWVLETELALINSDAGTIEVQTLIFRLDLSVLMGLSSSVGLDVE